MTMIIIMIHQIASIIIIVQISSLLVAKVCSQQLTYHQAEPFNYNHNHYNNHHYHHHHQHQHPNHPNHHHRLKPKQMSSNYLARRRHHHNIMNEYEYEEKDDHKLNEFNDIDHIEQAKLPEAHQLNGWPSNELYRGSLMETNIGFGKSSLFNLNANYNRYKTRSRRDNNELSLRKRRAEAEYIALSKLAILESYDPILKEFSTFKTGDMMMINGNSNNNNNNNELNSNYNHKLKVKEMKKKINDHDDDDIEVNNENSNTNVQRLCHLELPVQQNTYDYNSLCLMNPSWSSEIPPYILNLYRQLSTECSSISEAVHLMPYKSLVMRTLRQPSLIRAKLYNASNVSSYRTNIDSSRWKTQIDTNNHSHTGLEGKANWIEPNLVVELSLLNRSESLNFKMSDKEEEKEYSSFQVKRNFESVDSNNNNNNNEKKNKFMNEIKYGQFEVKPGMEFENIEMKNRPKDNGQFNYNSNFDKDAMRRRRSRLVLMKGNNMNMNNNNNNNDYDYDNSNIDQDRTSYLNNNNNDKLNEKITSSSSSSYLGKIEPFDVNYLNEACDMNKRLLPIEMRDKLCYWFPISNELAYKINGSIERLVEAELHLFKQKPRQQQQFSNENFHSYSASSSSNQLLLLDKLKTPSIKDQMNKQQHRTKRKLDHQLNDINKNYESQYYDSITKSKAKLHLSEPIISPMSTSSQMPLTKTLSSSQHKSLNVVAPSLYHLKTNLLEVSLYQILPRKKEDNQERKNKSVDDLGNDNLNHDTSDGFPLRLLDIRRIDLHSSGWETFYVKRAVEDWIRDPSLNLGLVIKTKSMFEEPIRIGLIRFADLYDNPRINIENDRPLISLDQQDISSQPTLLIYSTRTDL